MLLFLAFQPSFHHSLCLVWRDEKGYNQRKTIVHNYFPKNMLHLTPTSIIVSFFSLRCLHISHYACYCHLALNEKVINSCHYHCKLGITMNFATTIMKDVRIKQLRPLIKWVIYGFFLNKKYKCGLLSTYNIWTFFFHKSSYIGR